MREATILYKDEIAGLLTQHDNGNFTFRYSNSWFSDSSKASISLTLPKVNQEYNSEFLFPFFFNMLPEGSNKDVVCKYNRVDKNDYFGLLMITVKNDSIGAVRVIKNNEL